MEGIDMARIHLGSLSTGTLRPCDVIPELAYELERLRGALPRGLARDVRTLARTDYADDDLASNVWDDLIDAIQEFLPAYLTCSAHPGDGADIGIWPDLKAIESDRRDGELPDLDTTPKGYRGLAVHVSDHGNVSLYRCYANGSRRELWACV